MTRLMTMIHNRRAGWILLTGALTLAAAGCGTQQAGGGGFTMPPMPVEVALASMQSVADKFEAVGTIEALEAISVVAEIDAAVVSLPFEEGGSVRKGQLIARLDDSQLKAEVDRAAAVRDQSQATYDRVKAVVEQKAAAPQDLDDALAALRVAEANLAAAKARFDKTRITAPFDGIVGARRVSVGAFLRAGETITDLANIDEIRVIFSAPERFLPQLTRGADVTIWTPAYPGHTHTGKIAVIEPVVDPATRTARIVARVPNPEGEFRPGMSANVAAELARRDSAITIPNEAIFANAGQMFVFLVNPDSTVARAAITVGTRLADVAEITAGLTPGSVVVRAGHQKLFDGARVMPIADAGAGTSANAPTAQ